MYLRTNATIDTPKVLGLNSVTNSAGTNGFFPNGIKVGTYVAGIDNSIEIEGGQLADSQWTPNTVLQSDGNRHANSIGTGTGFLTNNGSGAFGWSLNAANLTNLNASSLGSGTVPDARLAGIGNVSFSTNQATMAPDFSKGGWTITTNASFTFLAPINVDATKFETCVLRVTNSSASTITATAPANVIPLGTMNVTNGGVTWFTFSHMGKWETNCVGGPLR